MRILFATRNARLGGGVTYLETLIPALQQLGHHCELMIRGGPGLARLESAVGKTWWLPPVPRWAAVKAYRIIGDKLIDLVSAHTTRTAQHLMPACRRAQIPLIMVIHNRTPLERCLAAANYAQAIVVLDRNTLDYFAGNYPQFANKLRLTSRLVDRSVFRPCPREDRSVVNVTYLGRLSRTKGEQALVLIDACEQLIEAIPNLELTVVGWGSRLRRVRRRAAQVSKKARRPVVQVMGPTLHPERYLQQADILIGAGRSAIEGLACHCTVIGLGFAGLFGMITTDNIDEAIAANFGDTGAHWPQVDASSLADQILQAYRQPATDYQWVETILDEQFAAPKVAAGLARIFEQAIQST